MSIDLFVKKIAMTFKYSIIGLNLQAHLNLCSKLNNLVGYEEVSYTENSTDLLDIILSETPNLIYINVDNYSEKNYNYLSNIINDLYRSFTQKPFIVALASSKEQAYYCIKNNFFYYLLRPTIEIELQKLDYKLRSKSFAIHDIPKKLCLQTYNDYEFIEIEDILYLKADNNSTEFFMLDGNKIIAYKTLKHFEALLPKSFSRIHQSFIINQSYISRIHFGKSECQLKPLKMRLPFSKSYRDVMTQLASNLWSNSLS